MQCNTVLRFRWSATASPVMQSSVSVLPCCRAAGPARQVARPSGRPMEAGTAGGPTARTQPSHSNTSASHPRYTTAALGASPGAGECGDHAARGGPDMNLKYAPLIALAIVTAGCGSTTATTASAGGSTSSTASAAAVASASAPAAPPSCTDQFTAWQDSGGASDSTAVQNDLTALGSARSRPVQ